MLSEKLKTLTRSNHQMVEKQLMVRLRSMNRISDYTTMLKLFYGYFGGLQQMLDKHELHAFLPDYSQRRKSTALSNDLFQFSIPLPPLAGKEYLPVVNNNMSSMGALYVMEGSTLGGRIIAQMVQKQLHLKGDIGMTFLKGYGDNTENMWNIFKVAIDNLKLSAPGQDAIFHTANDTFIKLGNWFAEKS